MNEHSDSEISKQFKTSSRRTAVGCRLLSLLQWSLLAFFSQRIACPPGPPEPCDDAVSVTAADLSAALVSLFYYLAAGTKPAIAIGQRVGRI